MNLVAKLFMAFLELSLSCYFSKLYDKRVAFYKQVRETVIGVICLWGVVVGI